MNKPLNTGVVIGAIVLVVIIGIAAGYKLMNGGQRNVSPEQQIQMMSHMKK